MGDLERDEYKQSLKATHGGHDDLFVSIGQIFFSMIIMDVRAGKLTVPIKRNQNFEESYFDPVWKQGAQGSDQGRDWSTREELLDERADFYEGE